ncbi:MAG: Bpu10I family restriction endonuclease [Proteobacteria bacterium]|nr:MAG: Bpu10I family restriction endonuclease [Pseudomonadota bacterium]
MFAHGDNLSGKENHQTKYIDEEAKDYLKQIRERYDQWKKSNLEIDGPFSVPRESDGEIVAARVALLNDYKDFLDQEHFASKFDSRSNLHSSVLEEFMFYLFKDMVVEINKHALFGKSHTFKDIFFTGDRFEDMVVKPRILVEKKDHDFAIGVKIKATLEARGTGKPENDDWDIPLVTIECKTYLDKTMLQDASSSASVVKTRSPNGLCLVVAEWLKLTEAVNLHKFHLDQIFVLRKQRNTDREFRYKESYVKNPIYPDVILELFNLVRNHLTMDWGGGISKGLERGFLI